MKAIILAGGFGTRLKEVVKDVPKPMASVLGKPFLEYQIEYLKGQGITEIILAVHHMANFIKSYFGNGLRWGVNIIYSDEEIPLGTAGAIKKAEKYIDDTFIVLNGDSYSQIDIKDFFEFHKAKKNKFTIALTETSKDDIENRGNVVVENNKIVSFIEKMMIQENSSCLINSGVYIFEPIIFDYIEDNKKISLENEVFPRLAKENLLGGYKFEGYFIDIGKKDSYNKFKRDVLKTLFVREEDYVRTAMKKISKNSIDFILVVNDNDRLLGVLNDRIIKNYLLEGGNIDDSVSRVMIKNPEKTGKVDDDKEKIYNILFSGIRHLPILDEGGKVIDVEFRTEKIKTESFPIIRGKSPFRISFAGGGTDLPVFFEKYGGVVINCTIDKYCYATLIKRADSYIIINSDTGKEVMFDLKKFSYDGNFDLIKSIIKIMNLDFGFNLYIYSDIPPGRGLGSSATLAVLIVRLIGFLQGVEYDDYKIAKIAYEAETKELGIKGGWQDQYAAVTGGFNFMEFNSEKTIIYPLRLKKEIINEFNHHLLLCYVGNTHFSGDLQENLQELFEREEEDVIRSCNELKNIAIEIKDSLLTNNLKKIGELLHKSWLCKKASNKKVTNPNIDKLYTIGLKNGAYGGKLLGSGGGGYILFFYSPEKRNQLVKALEAVGGEVLGFNFEFNGTHIWPVKSES